jgi:hypothetical protein
MKDLQMRGVKAAHKAKEEFKPGEWIFDTSARSWTSHNGVSFYLDRAEANSKAVLLEKVVMRAARNRMPDEKMVVAHQDDLVGSKNAM